MVAKSQIPGQGSASAHPCPDFKHWWLAFWAQALRSVPLGSAACGSLVLLITAWSLGRAAAFLASPECLRIGCSVSFESRPPDAMVWIDDHYAGRTPQDATGLCRGWHLLRMEKRGFQAVIRSVYVGRREQSLSVELSPFPVATLACESVPISAEVSVDGRVLGETPLEVPFRTGLHQVHFAAEGYAAWQQEVELAAGETKRVRAALRSRLETFLLDRVAAEPWRVGYAYDLAHQDLLAGRDDRALGVLERGLRAAADPRAPTGEAARLVQEINYIYQGQFKFGTPESLRGLQARLVELVERVARELPRNTYAGALL
ncbi:MAG: PEGA domain-containing protein, partial [Armatimonadetes bacterium]|nr:PEGA domain-containing protein [Armatimonadota bacterium]